MSSPSGSAQEYQRRAEYFEYMEGWCNEMVTRGQDAHWQPLTAETDAQYRQAAAQHAAEAARYTRLARER